MIEGFKQFIRNLEKVYGKFDPATNKFAGKSNADIARDLFYSDSQFSRLINQTASEGEYVRANKIISRYIENLKLKARLQQDNKPRSLLHLLVSNPKYLVISILALLGSAYLGYALSLSPSSEKTQTLNSEIPRDDMLRWAFETADVKSYTYLDDLPGDCIFPCYRLQGKWKLKEPYRLPVFSNYSGFHYLATDINMYARCMPEIDTAGNVMEGFEYQKHEIWYDILQRPVDSFTDLNADAFLKDSYTTMDFRQHEDFILVAHVHTFFRNSFYVEEQSIHRAGKVIGRNIEYEDLEKLNRDIEGITTDDLREAIESIVDNRLEDFSRPVECNKAEFEPPTVYEFQDNDEMAYSCKMTTGRLPLGYTKKYQLVDQVIKNSCWSQEN